MKTVAEMQSMIQEAYAILNELSKNLHEYNATQKEAFSVDFLKLKRLAEQRPLLAHAAAAAPDFTKKYYLSHLIPILQILDNNEDSWLLLHRISAGARSSWDLSDLMVDASTPSEKNLEAFLQSMDSPSLRQAFILDSMVIYLNRREKNQDIIDYIAGFAQFFGIDSNQIYELIQLAQLVTAQDVKKIENFCMSTQNFSIDRSIGSCYFCSFNMPETFGKRKYSYEDSDNYYRQSIYKNPFYIEK